MKKDFTLPKRAARVDDEDDEFSRSRKTSSRIVRKYREYFK